MSEFEQFRKFIGSFGSIEWSIAAVKAPISETTREISRHTGKAALQNVPLESNEHQDLLGPYITIYQLIGCDWTIVIYALGSYQYFNESVRQLSQKLKTQVLLYEAEDTSGAEGMKLYQNGELEKEILDEHDAEYIDELLEEMSEIEGLSDHVSEQELAATKALREVVDDYAIVFERYGVKAIGIYPKQNGAVAVEAQYKDQIHQVNLILYENSDDVDEELDDQSEW